MSNPNVNKLPPLEDPTTENVEETVTAKERFSNFFKTYGKGLLIVGAVVAVSVVVVVATKSSDVVEEVLPEVAEALVA